jgi:integrase
MAKPIKHGNSWRIRWIDERGKRRSEVYESYERAALQLARHELAVREVKLGFRSGGCPDKTFNDLADFWLESVAPNKRSEKDDRSIIEHHLRPELGTMKLSEIGVRQIDRYRLLHQKLAPQTVKNHITLVKTMLNRSVDLGWLATPPRFKVPRVPHDSQSFSYLQSENQIRCFLAAAREEGSNVEIFYKTAIYTGLRAGELAALRREDVDLERNQITVQRSFDGPTKSGRLRYVPIFAILKPSLAEWIVQIGAAPTLFPNEAGNMHGPAARIFQEIFQRVLTKAKFPLVLRRGRPRPYLTFHGLRHTFASLWMARGGDLFRLQALLGHQSISMTQRYSHLAPDAFAGEYGRFGAAENDNGKIVHLPALGTA